MITEPYEFPMSERLHDLVYGSFLSVVDSLHGLDAETRDISITQTLFDQLGINFGKWPSVTITGSKGKGSTSVMIASILAACGERVGTVTSPHMRKFNERIRVDGRCVSDELLESVAQDMEPSVRGIASELVPPKYLGPGGVILALAARIFEREGVTAVVIEAGRGGEFDETRLVSANVSVLTPIMLEHPDKLGSTVEEIARTKTFIAAPNSTLVYAAQTKSAEDAILDVASRLALKTEPVSTLTSLHVTEEASSGVTFDLITPLGTFNGLSVSLPGAHQAENAANAILATQALSRYGAKYSSAGVSQGIRQMRWPGRGQIVQHKPWVFVDGAINAESARYACDIVATFGARKLFAVICVPMPKDLDGVCREVTRYNPSMVLTQVDAPALKWYSQPLAIAGKYSTDVRFLESCEDALNYVLSNAHEEDGIVLLGTQSFVGYILRRWNIETCNIW